MLSKKFKQEQWGCFEEDDRLKGGTTILTLRTADDNYSLRGDSTYNLFLRSFLFLDDFKNKILFQEDKWL